MFEKLRLDFPFFKAHKDLVYLDNAATTQKPQQVIDAMTEFYTQHNAPVHRGVYGLAERATEMYEDARQTVAHYIGAFPDEVVFTRGTTDGINAIAQSWAAVHLKPGDEIIVTELEHHSNILPWLRLEQSQGIVLKYIPVTSDGLLDYDAYEALLTSRTKLVACTHTSNALGTRINLPVIIKKAREKGARVLIDAAQAAGREFLNVHDLKADFLVFSGHKMAGPTGIGVLYIARHMQDQVEPYQSGGGMVYSVDFHNASWLKPPHRYEAGTPPIAQSVGLAAAIRYIQEKMPFDALQKHEAALCAQLIKGLSTFPLIRMLGPIEQLSQSGHLVTFVSENMHAHDTAAYVDKLGICVRAGNHCAQPLHRRLGITGSLRVSFYAYSTESDVSRFLAALEGIQNIL